MEKDKEKAREGLLDRMSDTSTIEVYEASEEELKEAQEKADRYIEEAMERVLKEGDKKDKVEKSIEGEEDRESEEDEIEKNLQLLLDNDSLDDDFKASVRDQLYGYRKKKNLETNEKIAMENRRLRDENEALKKKL